MIGSSQRPPTGVCRDWHKEYWAARVANCVLLPELERNVGERKWVQLEPGGADTLGLVVGVIFGVAKDATDGLFFEPARLLRLRWLLGRSSSSACA